eukprot:gene15922-7256_t
MEYLRWLMNHIKHRPSTTNFKRRTNDVINVMSEITEDSADDDEKETTKTNDEFLNTMHSMQKAMTDTASPEQESFDDDKHFCSSLLGPMRSLEPRYKSMAKLQIMNVFNDIEWHKDSQQKAHYQQVPGAGNINYQMNEASMSQQYYRPRKQPQNFNVKTNAPGSYSQEMQMQENRQNEYPTTSLTIL